MVADLGRWVCRRTTALDQ